jgi:hypothetical protein
MQNVVLNATVRTSFFVSCRRAAECHVKRRYSCSLFWLEVVENMRCPVELCLQKRGMTKFEEEI